ncbi:hypothetical protein FQN50_002335 [Emmonsiellopsis sp. PD_5]|nr:hypothetical protein FQN50_002335 [Emmonsiellopsis sp. PD_5]
MDNSPLSSAMGVLLTIEGSSGQANSIFAKDEQDLPKAVQAISKWLKLIVTSTQSRLKTTKAVPDLSLIYDLNKLYLCVIPGIWNPGNGDQRDRQDTPRLQAGDINQEFYVVFAYFFITTGLTLVFLAVLHGFGKRHKTRGEVLSILSCTVIVDMNADPATETVRSWSIPVEDG